MPGIYRRTLDLTVKECQELYSLGVKAVNLYMKVSENLKDNKGKTAFEYAVFSGDEAIINLLK